jgi:parallel beta-helix repeat protein
MPVSFEFGSTEPFIITSIYEGYSELNREGRIPPAPDPRFVDPFGADGILGTEDDDFHLAPGSSAIDTGTNDTEPPLQAVDLDGNPRIISDRVDMGAYEFQGIIYVGGDIPDNPRGYGTENDPMSSIQEAIDLAKNGYTVLVRPGVYGKIDFTGKAITVTATDGAAVINEPWNGRAGDPRPDAVTFHTGEGPDSVLKNFIITGAGAAISLNYASRPTIRNLTIVDNKFGIAAYENANPDISNCILWNNEDGNLFQCDVRYSCVEGGAPGEGNISVEPLFVDEDNGDYYLRSEGWRWSSYTETWTYDDVTSWCIDAGDPASPLGNELMSVPRDPNNRYGLNMRINMGAFGGTVQASMAPTNWVFPEYETIPPAPNPAQWTPAGVPREVVSEDDHFTYYAQMTAVEAADASGWVEYCFECTTESGFSSDWQSSPTYSVRLGRGGQGQRFRVKTRDLYANETAWSEELPAN